MKAVSEKMHDTDDRISTWKALIDKYVKSMPKKKQNLIFSCFIDFRKTLDLTTREKLFDKLRRGGNRGLFLEVLISMYSNDKSVVKISNKLTLFFPCYSRIKQGYMLSPTLFNFYPSDLPKVLNSTAISANIFLGEKFINCLLNAHDLVIFSRPEKKVKGLQNLLNKLESFCDYADLDVELR